MLISTFFKEDTATDARAEVHETNNGYEVQYYDMNGNFMLSEEYHDETIQRATTIAANWASGAKTLNG